MITERQIEYAHSGTTLEGFLAYDNSKPGPMPAVMISHAWGGKSEFECDKAKELAKLGYIGFALDVYGKGVKGSGPEENTKLVQPFLEDRRLLQARLTASLDTLLSIPEVDNSRIAAMGYCFGGLCVLDLARIGSDILGVISIHGMFNPPGNTDGNKIKAKILCLHGNDDPMVPVDTVIALEKELTEAQTDWQIHVYGNTFHAFTNPQANDRERGTVYDENADKRSWISTKNFLEEILS